MPTITFSDRDFKGIDTSARRSYGDNSRSKIYYDEKVGSSGELHGHFILESVEKARTD